MGEAFLGTDFIIAEIDTRVNKFDKIPQGISSPLDKGEKSCYNNRRSKKKRERGNSMIPIHQRIDQLLSPESPCPCGKSHPVSLRRLVMEEGALERLPEVIASLGDYSSVVMICDEHTYLAAGKRVEALCRLSQTICLQIPADGVLHASEEVVDYVRGAMGPCDLLLAVGSGTIHDITRYMATEMSLDFVSLPTAASVDGFLSSIAAMTWHGVKRSFPAKPPIALVADSLVLAAAPCALTAAGVGDLLGKYTAIFDWRMSHLLTGEYICEKVISLVEEAVEAVSDCAQAVAAQDPSAVEAVMYGLVLSGMAMQMVGNSRPASGAEHHVSHFIEMDVLTQGNTALHGEKVGVAAALVADRYHAILSRPASSLDTTAYEGLPVPRIQEVFADRAREVLEAENTPDPLSAVDKDKLISLWDELGALSRKTLPTGQEIGDVLSRIGAPTTLEEIGMPPDCWDTLWEMAPFVRRRLTFMRVVKCLGL